MPANRFVVRLTLLILLGMCLMKPATAITISNSVYTLNQALEDILFPNILPYDEGYLKVTDLHSLWYAQYGNPKGVPVVVIHGGPGFGCGPNDMRYFDPAYFRIILFDQRGAKRSKPLGETRENSTETLIEDIETLRAHLNIHQWFVFGGSWGSALAVLYGEAHPKPCLGFVLRGIFLGRKTEYEQVWYGMKDTFPEEWDEFQKFLPANERGDLIEAYYKRVMDPDPKIHMPAACAFTKYDITCASLRPNPELLKKILEDDAVVLGQSRIFAYYSKHQFFLNDDRLVNDLSQIQHLPATIVHGRYDTICRAKSAYELHQKWPGSELVFVQDAGHAAMEPGIASALIEATEKVKNKI